MFPLPEGSTLSFFLLFVGSVVPQPGSGDVSEAVIMESIRAHHRSLYKLSAKLGGKRYSYDTITSEVTGEEACRDHYGEAVWERLRAAKRKYDPYLYCALVSRCGIKIEMDAKIFFRPHDTLCKQVHSRWSCICSVQFASCDYLFSH